jgi:hypothetical protein
MKGKFAVLAAVAAVSAGPASGAVVFFGGHAYEYVAALDIAWLDARDGAAAAVHDGHAGYLATVTSAAENEFLRASFSTGSGAFAGAWLGGDIDGGGIGRWATGPETGQQFSTGGAPSPGAYANWGGIEPNNAPSKAYMNIGGSFAGIANGAWADAAGGLASGGDPIKGYIIEYATTPGVPEPGAWALMILGFGGVGAVARRRRAYPSAA